MILKIACLNSLRMVSKRHLLWLLVVLASCGGTLSEKERKALHEEMKLREVAQIRDEDIVTQALSLGRQARKKGPEVLADSLDFRYEIFDSVPEDQKLAELWEAYADAFDKNIDPGDNIQRDYPDYLIYTYPVFEKDSTFEMVVLRMPKKSVVLTLISE